MKPGHEIVWALFVFVMGNLFYHLVLKRRKK